MLPSLAGVHHRPRRRQQFDSSSGLILKKVVLRSTLIGCLCSQNCLKGTNWRNTVCIWWLDPCSNLPVNHWREKDGALEVASSPSWLSSGMNPAMLAWAGTRNFWVFLPDGPTPMTSVLSRSVPLVRSSMGIVPVSRIGLVSGTISGRN